MINTKKAGEIVEFSTTPTFEIFYNEGFGIYQTKTNDGETIAIKGNFPLPLNMNQVYKVKGKVILRGMEKQVEVAAYKSEKPKGESNVVSYLQQLKGLKSRAATIYEKFGDSSIAVLKKNPTKISDNIKGISEKMAKSWQEALKEKEAKEEDILYLLNLGLNSRQSNLLIEHYGENIRHQIKENPYILLHVESQSGFGFLKVDDIALKIGFDFADPERIEHGIVHVLKEAGSMGHTFLPKEELVKALKDAVGVRLTFTQMDKALKERIEEVDIHARKINIDLEDLETRVKKINSLTRKSAKEKYRYPLFEPEERHIESALENLVLNRKIENDRDRIGLTYLKEREDSAAYEVYRLSKEKKWKNTSPVERILDDYLNKNKIELEERQREAVIRFSQNDGGLYVLNGSAGCGKTFTLKIILHVLQEVFKLNKRKMATRVLAPTGKASKVASKATGIEAETIHRGLEYMEGIGFQRNARNHLEENVLVVDETSMVDVALGDSLFQAISTGTKVILLGDTKQLPSVGAGNVLHDIINSGMVEVITLNVSKRQAEESGLTKNSNQIIAGKMIETTEETKDAFVLHEEDDARIQQKTLASIKRVLSFPDYTLEDVQVLVPQKRGTVGVYELNRLIQQTFNTPTGTDMKLRNILSPVPIFFQKGDKVIHIRNSYQKEWHNKVNGRFVSTTLTGITNGETGVIEDVIPVPSTDSSNKRKKRLVVKYESGYMFYDEGEEIKDLDHAYCLSIHKSQGSQWKAVILPISKQHAFFLDQNLIYTAWTRSQEFAVAIGPKKTIATSIRKKNSIKRFTELQNNLIKVYKNKEGVA